jgi:hypothetical protein
MTVANLAKALGVRSTRPTDPYFREPDPLPWWTTVEPIVRLLVIIAIVLVVALLMVVVT